MTTKLLQTIHAQEQAALAARHNAGPKPETKQAGRKWCIAACRPFMSEDDRGIADRLVRECAAAFPDLGGELSARVDGGAAGDYGMAARLDAVRKLHNIRQAVRSPAWPHASNCVDWIVQMWTLSEVAAGAQMWRWTGKPARRIADTRQATPMLMCVITATGNYFRDTDADKSRWAARKALADLEQITAQNGSL